MPSIVVMEEDPLMRALLVEWLSAEGYRVRAGPRCDDQHLDEADLAIVDVAMPRQDGGARLRSIQSRHPRTPLIAISGQFRPGIDLSPTAARALGVRHVVAKPCSRHELIHAVRVVIGPACDANGRSG
jgi:CheY-like chemotaxis protein